MSPFRGADIGAARTRPDHAWTAADRDDAEAVTIGATPATARRDDAEAATS